MSEVSRSQLSTRSPAACIVRQDHAQCRLEKRHRTAAVFSIRRSFPLPCGGGGVDCLSPGVCRVLESNCMMTGSLQHQKHAYSQLCGLFFFGLDVSPNHLWSLCSVEPSVLAQRTLGEGGQARGTLHRCDSSTQLGIKLSWEHLFSAFSLRIKRVSILEVHFPSFPPQHFLCVAKRRCPSTSTGRSSGGRRFETVSVPVHYARVFAEGRLTR